MTNIIRAEFLKSKRTMSSKLIVVFPIITLARNNGTEGPIA